MKPFFTEMCFYSTLIKGVVKVRDFGLIFLDVFPTAIGAVSTSMLLDSISSQGLDFTHTQATRTASSKEVLLYRKHFVAHLIGGLPLLVSAPLTLTAGSPANLERRGKCRMQLQQWLWTQSSPSKFQQSSWVL